MPFTLSNTVLNFGFVLLWARRIGCATFMPGGIAEPACGSNVVLGIFAAVLPGMQVLSGTLTRRKKLARQLVLLGKRGLIGCLPHEQTAVKAATVLRGVGALTKSLELGHGSRKDACQSR